MRERKPFDVIAVLKFADNLGVSGLASIIFENLTEENSGTVLSACPFEVRESINAYIERFPADSDEAGWENMVFVQSENYPAWVTEEDIRATKEASRRAFRNGLKLYRANSGKI